MSFFSMGGFFMFPLLIIAVAALIVAIISAVQINRGKQAGERTNLVMHLGVLALVVGMLGQMRGLYAALVVIEQVSDISPTLLAGGLKVSFIAPIFGMMILCASLIVWIGLRWFAASRASA